jgi:predicted HTH transcriptional regulator
LKAIDGKFYVPYSPEDYEISQNFVIAKFRYNIHALEVLNSTSGKVIFPETFPEKLTVNEQTVFSAIIGDPYINTTELALAIGVDRRTITNAIKHLKELGLIKRIGSDRQGYWEVQSDL